MKQRGAILNHNEIHNEFSLSLPQAIAMELIIIFQQMPAQSHLTFPLNRMFQSPDPCNDVVAELAVFRTEVMLALLMQISQAVKIPQFGFQQSSSCKSSILQHVFKRMHRPSTMVETNTLRI